MSRLQCHQSRSDQTVLTTSHKDSKGKRAIHGYVLYVEVYGLYMKRQGKGKRGKEDKIATVHQGWEVNGIGSIHG